MRLGVLPIGLVALGADAVEWIVTLGDGRQPLPMPRNLGEVDRLQVPVEGEVGKQRQSPGGLAKTARRSLVGDRPSLSAPYTA